MNPVQTAMPTSVVTLGDSFGEAAPSDRETRQPTTYALSNMSATVASDPKVNSMAAVLIPCRNEAATVARVVNDFRAALPGCAVYVYDNGSTDGTGELARAAGAVVRLEASPGKGVVVRRMFAEVDADVYLLVDGDATYDAARAPDLVATLIDDDLDMVT